MTKRYAAAMTALLLFTLTGCSSSGGDPEPSDAAFCAAFEEWMDLGASLGASADPLESATSGDSDSDELLTADQLHAIGQTLLSGAAELDGIMDEIVANTKDPQVVEALQVLNGIVVGTYGWTGEIARDSNSVLELSTAIAEDYGFVIELQASFDASDGDAIDQYLLATCPDLDWLLGGDAQSYDAIARADLATLAKEISTFYVDHDPTGPDPVITVENGRYLMFATDLGPVGDGNRLSDQVFNAPTDWCIEVTNDKGNIKTFSYSAQSGVAAGTCR